MRIFISYAREEKSFVSGFADLLRTEGYDPWYDGDLPGGDDWKEKIYREIEKCLILIYVLTPASSTSIWCNHEVAHARSKKKRIIPVQLKPAPIPEPIAQLHCFDITAFASEPLTTIAPLVEQLARISRRRFWRALAAVLILFAVLATIILGGLALYSRPLVVADFNNCAVTNNVGGALNTAFGSDSSIQYEFMEDSSGGGCMAKLSYTLGEWSAFVIPLEGIDLREYYSLNFDIRTDSIIGTDWQLKLELKRDNQREVRIVYVSGITGEWLNIQVNLDSFVRPNMVVDDLSRFDDIEQLFITFDSRSGAQGVVYIDNVEFRR